MYDKTKYQKCLDDVISQLDDCWNILNKKSKGKSSLPKIQAVTKLIEFFEPYYTGAKNDTLTYERALEKIEEIKAKIKHHRPEWIRKAREIYRHEPTTTDKLFDQIKATILDLPNNYQKDLPKQLEQNEQDINRLSKQLKELEKKLEDILLNKDISEAGKIRSDLKEIKALLPPPPSYDNPMQVRQRQRFLPDLQQEKEVLLKALIFVQGQVKPFLVDSSVCGDSPCSWKDTKAGRKSPPAYEVSV